MFLNVKMSEQTEVLVQKLKQYSTALIKDFELTSAPIVLEGVDNLYDLYDSDRFFLVNDGMIHVSNNGQILCSFDEGDLVGITPSFGMPFPTLYTDEYVELTPIDRDQFLKFIYSNPKRMHLWSHFLICQNSFFSSQLAEQTQALMKPNAGFLNFTPGETIITQGDSADLVYTIVEGTADVFVDGVKVGEVGEDEVFGAMAVFTGEPRSATVTARTPCSVIAVPQHDFVSLIEAQPKAAVNLIESLAQKIMIMNQQLIEQTK